MKNWNSLNKTFDIITSKSEIYFLKHFTEDIFFLPVLRNSSYYNAFFYICHFPSLSHCVRLQWVSYQQQCSPTPTYLILTSFNVSLRNTSPTSSGVRFQIDNCQKTRKTRKCQMKKRLYCCCYTHTVRRYAGEYGRLFWYVSNAVNAEDITCNLQHKFKHKYAIGQINCSL